jgi:hypothetical protein
MAELLWPEFGNSFELNIFYKVYETCGGEIGEAYIFFWSAKEIKEYEPLRAEMYPSNWRIFGDDGGGTCFGFSDKEKRINFFSCDPIDATGSVTWLGAWPEFIRRVRNANYV